MPSEAEVEEVLNRYADELRKYPNVNGLGIRRESLPDGDTKPVIQVYVSKKVPEEELEPSAILPRQLEAVNVRVREIGSLTLE
jgi:hypothetical protein